MSFPSLTILFPSVSFVDFSICLLNIVIPQSTNLDILLLGDHKVSITIYMQMFQKLLSPASTPLACVCVCARARVCVHVCLCNYVILYSKLSAGSSLLQVTCHRCHCTLPYLHCMYLPFPLPAVPIPPILVQTKLYPSKHSSNAVFIMKVFLNSLGS